jgi:hypothetical protein
MRKLILMILVTCIFTATAYSEEAAVIPEGSLRISESHNFALASDGEICWGFGAEYATTDWLNLQVLWNSGLRLHPEIGASTLYLGFKTYIFGDGALVPVAGQWLRFSTALGLLVPPDETEPTLLDQDQKLWGSSLRLFSDFICNKYFYINLYGEAVFYPPQHTKTKVFYGGDKVAHYLDLTAEMELRFEVPVKHGIVLMFGAPVRFFYAPWMNAEDEHAESQYLLTTGGYFGLTSLGGSHPVEIYLRYKANILGQYVNQSHHASIIFKVTFDIGTMKTRAEKRANNAPEENDE